MNKPTIAVAADHAGFHMKELIRKHLLKQGYAVHDFGTHSDEDVDYPDCVHPLGYAIENNTYDVGFVFCGSGNGVNMTVNKHQNVRSGLCWNEEIAQLVKAHNNANICAIPARFVTANDVIKIVNVFLHTEFEGGRHERRVNKIPLNK
ncbi:MAG TPA: RpiB/LacA/LacB family sugar-phosphate isomerase [Bacteroidales bacterium]|nr:RpiB/LacA/LacB family sugar-phosphate isomerase [Bacteroidales bacterium]